MLDALHSPPPMGEPGAKPAATFRARPARAARRCSGARGGALLCALGLLACGVDEQAARRAIVVQTLLDQDRELARERPARIAEKYRQMAAGPQEFLRGTAALFYRDLYADPGSSGAPSGAGVEVVLYGDLHVENVGSSPDQAGAVFEATDFDASIRGPFDWDVHRAALGLAVALRLCKQGEEGARETVRTFAGAYLRALEAGTASPVQPLRVDGGVGTIVVDVLTLGQQADDQRADLARDTEIVGGKRRLLRDRDARPVPAPFAGHLAEAIDAYRQSRRSGPGDAAAFAVKDAIERLGTGVSSMPNLRFYVLVEGPVGEDDDWILEMKEERDPPAAVAWSTRGATGWLADRPSPKGPLSNATRAASGAFTLLSSPTLEPDLGHVTLLGVPFLVRTATRARRNLAVPSLAAAFADGTYGRAERDAFADVLGRLLGAGHARSGAGAAIRRAVADPAAFVEGAARGAVTAERRLRADLSLFRAALDELGPLLGAPL